MSQEIRKHRYSIICILESVAAAALVAAFAAAPRSALAQDHSYSTSAVDRALWSGDEADSLAPSAAPSPAPQYGQSSGHGYSNDQSRWSHIAIEAGGGFSAPISSSIAYGYNLTFGGGWMFTPRLGALLEYQFNRNTIPGAVLASVGAPGGNVNTWSLTVDPLFNYLQHGNWGGYVTGGGGFYRKVTNYTSPTPVQFCNYFYGYCGTTYQNTTIGHFSSNQGGLNFGAGFTWHPTSWNRARFYAEARYVWVDSPGNTPSQPGTGTESLIPVTFGIRF